MSSVFFVGIFLFNLFNYLFQIAAARFLGPVLYGDVGAITSILYIFSIPSEVVNTIIVRFASKFRVEKKFGELRGFFNFAIKNVGILFSLIILCFFILTPAISNFLNLSSPVPLLIFFLFLFTMIPIKTNRGFMQAGQQFSALSFNMIVQSILKFFLSILFLYIGFQINGVFAAILFSGIVTAGISFIPLRKIFKYASKKIDGKKILSNSKSISFILIGITAMYSIDIVLAKHFLSPEKAGVYAALSLLGKMIFFGSFAIIKVMFSKLFERDAVEKRKLAIKAISLVVFGSGIALGIFFFFPQKLTLLLLGNEYIEVSKYLFEFGLAMTLFSLSYLIVHYNISRESTRGTFIFPLFAAVEIILIVLFSQSIGSITHAIFLTMSILFVFTIVFPYFKRIRKILSDFSFD
jgi:O-antigen/teichoic acid export membrane protein